MRNGNPSLGSIIVARDLRINQLLAEATLVGGIYTMGYEDALVLTNDLWKRNAQGVPLHCFLLATAIEPDAAPDPDDEEVILLRVTGPASLPAEAELVQVRAEAMREMVTLRGTEGAIASPAIIDVLTRNEIQFSAVKAKVLGTFYENQIGTNTVLSFGSDIETYYSASRYKVYKPHGRSLAAIASYPLITDDEEVRRQAGERAPRRVPIGTVRYSSSTRRRALAAPGAQNTAVPVAVNVEDFVSMKTAVFGMTRLGKSNTMKTIAVSVFQHSLETGQTIGQLLFDPAGEYANVNEQDRTALAALGPNYVTIFRYGADGSTPGIRPLATNFFAEAMLPEAWAIITGYLAANNRNVRFIDNFIAVNLIGPDNEADDRSLYTRARQRRAVFYGCLLKAGFQAPPNFSCAFTVNRDVVAAVNQAKQHGIDDFTTAAGGRLRLNADRLIEWCDSLAAAIAAVRAAQPNWIDADMEALLNLYTSAQGSGYRVLIPLRAYHGLGRVTDYAQDVLQELVSGKIVIVDLSLGSESILRYCSERIITYILSDASQRFAEGQTPRRVQIFLEEAHRLFDRENMRVRAESDPYVRLAKEAAKYKIGLIYATQEVSSVDPLILSNTSNWVVTHLNNHSEVKELSKYYDFQDFADITLRAEDVGFARIKTRSGRYIVPTQVDLFSQARIDAALAVARQTRGSV